MRSTSRWRWPPESRAPRSPTTVSQPCGWASTISRAFASRRAASTRSSRHLAEAVGDVLADRALEEHRLLRHDRHEPAERAQVELLHVDAVEQHPAAGRPQEAEHEVEERRLARARRAHERDRLARSDLERHVVERRRDAEVVAVLHVLEPQVARHLGHRALALVELEVGLLHDLGDGAHGLGAAGDDGQQHEQVRGRAGEEREVGAEQHDLARRDRDEARDGDPGGEHEASDPEQLQAHPRQRREPAVQQVELEPRAAHALGAACDPA